MTETKITKSSVVYDLLVGTNMAVKDIARETGASRSLISRVNAGVVGVVEGQEYPIRPTGEERNKRMRNMLADGFSIEQVADRYNLSVGYVEKLIR